MSHILIALAICAGLVVYPGGCSAVLAGWLAALGSRLGPDWRRARLRGWPWPGGGPAAAAAAAGLAGLVVVCLPWSGSPVAALDVAGLSGPGLGGLAVSVAGLWCLQSLSPGRSLRGWPGLLGALWGAGVLGLALALGAPGWSGILAAGGAGPEIGRVLLGLLCLGLTPLLADPSLDPFAAAACCARVAVGGTLCLPQLRSLSVVLVLLIWWGASLLAGAAAAAAPRGASRWRSLKGRLAADVRI